MKKHTILFPIFLLCVSLSAQSIKFKEGLVSFGCTEIPGKIYVTFTPADEFTDADTMTINTNFICPPSFTNIERFGTVFWVSQNAQYGDYAEFIAECYLQDSKDAKNIYNYARRLNRFLHAHLPATIIRQIQDQIKIDR